MDTIEEKVKKLGEMLADIFDLTAHGNLQALRHIWKLKSLSSKSQKLQDELAKDFGIPVTSPLETLQGILVAAEKRKIQGTDALKQAVDTLAKVTPQLPDNSCPTPEGLQSAVRKAMDKKPKP